MSETTDQQFRRGTAGKIRAWRKAHGLRVLLAVLLAAGFAADAVLEQGIASGVLFVGVLTLAAQLPGVRPTMFLGIAASALTVLGYFVSPPGGPMWKAVANRLLALFAIWVTAALVARFKRQNLRRDLAESRAALSEQQFRVTVESSPAAMLLVGRQGCIALANPAAERLFGYQSGNLAGQPIETLMAEGEPAAHALLREAFTAEAEPRSMGGGREVAGIDKQGRALALEIQLARVVTVEGEFVLATVTDVGEARQLERARTAQAVAYRLLDAEEAQRKRMAHEIHDALGQALTALTLDIGWVSRHLPAQSVAMHARVREMESLAINTIDEVRRLSAKLRPTILDDQGLLAAIRWQVGDFEKRFGLRCTVDLPEARLAWGADRDTAVFRVLQESLTNVARHAQARNVAVKLQLESRGETVLEVRDDGGGFDAEQGVRPGALGLLGMRERATLYGGSLTVVAMPAGGTTVTLRLPWGPDEPLSEGARADGCDADAPPVAQTAP